MKKLSSRLAAATAAASLALSPIAAHANTRAGDMATIYSPHGDAASGLYLGGNHEDDDDDDDRRGLLLVALFGLAAIFGMVAVIGDDDDQSPPGNQSPGAN